MVKPRRFSTIKHNIGQRAHIELAKGDDAQNEIYCSKGGDVWKHGTIISGQGSRSDLKDVIDLIASGEVRDSEIAKSCPAAFIKYSKGIKEYIRAIRPIPERDFKTNVYFYYGPPGTGKSRRCLQEAQMAGGDIYYKPRGDWWDGYKQQPNVIIDDFYGWIKYDEMLKICDRYPYRVPIKGSFEQFTSKNIWITSNYGIDRIYRFVGYDCEAMRRRCNIVEEINFIN